jgi:rSAM-associated Gly-rich repeat protein
MTQDRRSSRVLSALLPTGMLGLSMGLASADASATTSAGSAPATGKPESVSNRLEAIRNQVSVVIELPGSVNDALGSEDDNVRLAWWGNGWRRGWGWGGGWHNGGWGNGGWHNGGWGNGGWHNGGWGNGWHNW